MHPQGLKTQFTTKKTAKKHYSRNIYISQEETQSTLAPCASLMQHVTGRYVSLIYLPEEAHKMIMCEITHKMNSRNEGKSTTHLQ